jgi:hypothetical protein
MEFFKSEHGRPFVLWAWDARVKPCWRQATSSGILPAWLRRFACRLTIDLGVAKVAGGVA